MITSGCRTKNCIIHDKNINKVSTLLYNVHVQAFTSAIHPSPNFPGITLFDPLTACKADNHLFNNTEARDSVRKSAGVRASEEEEKNCLEPEGGAYKNHFAKKVCILMRARKVFFSDPWGVDFQ